MFQRELLEDEELAYDTKTVGFCEPCFEAYQRKGLEGMEGRALPLKTAPVSMPLEIQEALRNSRN